MRDWGGCGGREGRQCGGTRDRTWPYLQIQLHELPSRHRQIGEDRVDFPQEPKGDDTWGEGETIRAGQSQLPVQEPARVLCLPGAALASGASGRGWESKIPARQHPQHQRRKNPSSFLPVSNLPGFRGSHESRCPGAAWCMSHHTGNVLGKRGQRCMQ